MSKFSNFKIKWPKSVEKLENGGRLGPSAKTWSPKTVRWIRQWPHISWCCQQFLNSMLPKSPKYPFLLAADFDIGLVTGLAPKTEFLWRRATSWSVCIFEMLNTIVTCFTPYRPNLYVQHAIKIILYSSKIYTTAVSYPVGHDVKWRPKNPYFSAGRWLWLVECGCDYGR